MRAQISLQSNQHLLLSSSLKIFLSNIFFFKIIYLWLHFIAALRLYLVLESGDYSLLGCMGFSLWWLPLIAEHEFQLGAWASVAAARGLAGCSLQALESRLGSCVTRGFIAPWHVEYPQTRGQTCVPCISRRILSHWTTREVSNSYLLNFNKSCLHKLFNICPY